MRNRIVAIIKKSKTIMAVAALSLTALAGVSLLTAQPAYAAVDTTAVCQGVSSTGGTCNGDASQFNKVIKLVIEILSAIAGIAAVIMIVVGGLRYVTSGGDSSKVAGAKSAIIYAVIGLVIVALAQVIVRYVLTNATK